MGSEETAQEPAGITLTDSAREHLQAAIDGHSQPVAGIRLAIAGRGPEGFLHSLSIVEEGEEDAEDVRTDAEGIAFFLEGGNAASLDGVRINFDATAGGGAIQFENPNSLWQDPVSQKIQDLFDAQINPQIAQHGGSVQLVRVEDETAYLEFGGGCVGCGLIDVTLKQGVEVAIMEAAPEIKRVVDTTDHASGTNPYQSPSKK